MLPRAEVLHALTELAKLVYDQVYGQNADYKISYGASRCYEKTIMAHGEIALALRIGSKRSVTTKVYCRNYHYESEEALYTTKGGKQSLSQTPTMVKVRYVHVSNCLPLP